MLMSWKDVVWLNMAKGDIQILPTRIKFIRIQVTQLDPPNEGHSNNFKQVT